MLSYSAMKRKSFAEDENISISFEHCHSHIIGHIEGAFREGHMGGPSRQMEFSQLSKN